MTSICILWVIGTLLLLCVGAKAMNSLYTVWRQLNLNYCVSIRHQDCKTLTQIKVEQQSHNATPAMEHILDPRANRVKLLFLQIKTKYFIEL